MDDTNDETSKDNTKDGVNVGNTNNISGNGNFCINNTGSINLNPLGPPFNEFTQLKETETGVKNIIQRESVEGKIRQRSIFAGVSLVIAIMTYGRRVAAMVLNGLGFMNSRLSMTTHFFQDKPVAQLLGSEVGAEHLNDDCLGRCLDKIAEYGVTKLYSEVAFEIARDFDENYRAATQEVTIYGIKQRWLLIESKHALARELQTFQRRLDKKSAELAKALWHLGNQEFKCSTDAEKSTKPLLKSLKYHRIHYQILPIERYAEKGRPKPGAQKEVVGYQI